MTAAQPAADRLSRAHVEEDFRALETAVRTHWSYYDLRVRDDGLDLGKAVEDVLSRFPDGATRDEFRGALVGLVASLHDGHAGVFVPRAVEPARRSLPFSVRECAEGIIVSRIAGDAPPDGLRVGDRLTAIDGVPIDRAIEVAAATAFGSTPGTRRGAAISAALQRPGDSCVLEIETPGGDRRACTVATLPKVPADLRRPPSGAPPVLDWPAAKTARITIPTFTVADWEAWRKAPVEEREGFLEDGKKRIDDTLDAAVTGGAESVILDLRGNSGGTDLLGIHLAQRLLDQPFVYFRLSARTSGAWMEPAGITYQPREPYFSGGLIALTDERVFSTTDNFLRCLGDLRPGLVVIGRPTGAGTGAPSPIATLPRSGAIITLCAHRVYGPAGKLVEGAGTTPDQLITWTRQDVLSGRDPDLAAALELIARRP